MTVMQPMVRAAGQSDTRDDAVCGCCGQALPVGRVFQAALLAASLHLGVTLAELRGPSRRDACVRGRALVTWACAGLGQGMSYGVIGRLLGDRDHSCVTHWHRKAIRLRLEDRAFALACAEAARLAKAAGAQPEVAA